MNAVVRIWLAFSAIGAALIHLAVGAGAPLVLSVILVGLGIAEFGWGALVLIRARILAAGVVLGAALIPVAVWAATNTLGSSFGVAADATLLPFLPMLVASLFNLFLAGSLAVLRRRAAARTSVASVASRPSTSATDAAGESQGWRFVTGLVVAGFLFAGLTTPALAATDAGSHAVPHGSHAVPGLELPDRGHGQH